MERISLYTDVDNLVEIFNMDRTTKEYQGLFMLISQESTITLCETEDVAVQNQLFETIAPDLTSGNFVITYRTEEQDFLNPPFKTNLHQHFDDKRTVLFSYDCEQVKKAKSKTGVLMASVGEEVETYLKLNFKKDFFRASKILTIGTTFNQYQDFKPYILPFFELIINEPYLFKPDRNDWRINEYIENNFKPLMRTLLEKVQNKVNIIINTYVDDRDKIKLAFPFYDHEIQKETGKGFQPLYNLCTDYLNSLLGHERYKLWLVISPQSRNARHDRFILTNYQYIESGAGLSYFDDMGNFTNRGDAIHLYSIMHDEARKELIPSVINNVQTKVIDSVKQTHPDRIFGTENGDSYFLKFIDD